MYFGGLRLDYRLKSQWKNTNFSFKKMIIAHSHKFSIAHRAFKYENYPFGGKLKKFDFVFVVEIICIQIEKKNTCHVIIWLTWFLCFDMEYTMYHK